MINHSLLYISIREIVQKHRDIGFLQSFNESSATETDINHKRNSIGLIEISVNVRSQTFY